MISTIASHSEEINITFGRILGGGPLVFFFRSSLILVRLYVCAEAFMQRKYYASDTQMTLKKFKFDSTVCLLNEY